MAARLVTPPCTKLTGEGGKPGILHRFSHSQAFINAFYLLISYISKFKNLEKWSYSNSIQSLAALPKSTVVKDVPKMLVSTFLFSVRVIYH